MITIRWSEKVNGNLKSSDTAYQLQLVVGILKKTIQISKWQLPMAFATLSNEFGNRVGRCDSDLLIFLLLMNNPQSHKSLTNFL